MPKKDLSSLICTEHKVDVLCLQETHVDEDAPSNHLTIENLDLTIHIASADPLTPSYLRGRLQQPSQPLGLQGRKNGT